MAEIPNMQYEYDSHLNLSSLYEVSMIIFGGEGFWGEGQFTIYLDIERINNSIVCVGHDGRLCGNALTDQRVM
jgi:hypothetical protein